VRFLEHHKTAKEVLRWFAAVIIVVGTFLLVLLFPDTFLNFDCGKPIVPFDPYWTYPLPVIGGGIVLARGA